MPQARLSAAGKAALAKKLAAEAQQSVAVLPAAMSVADPAFQQAVIVALIEHDGDVEVACQRVGCTFADYLHMSSRPEFKTLQDQIIYAKVDVPNKIKVRKAITDTAVGGNAYAGKVLQDTAASPSASEDIEREQADMRLADRETLGRKVEENIRLLIALLEKIRECRYDFLKVNGDVTVTVPIVTKDEIAADLGQPYLPDDATAAS